MKGMMNIKATKSGVATYLAPNMALLEESLPVFKKTVNELITAGPANIVIDLQRVGFIDSCCLEYIQDLYSELHINGGSLRLAAATELCQEILSITKTDLIISTYDNLESAGRSFI